MTVELHQLGVEVGAGGLLGLLVGYASKKLAKLVAILAGLHLAFLAFLQTEGVVSVQWGTLARVAAEIEGAYRVPDYLLGVIGVVPLGAGFATGLLIGFKKG